MNGTYVLKVHHRDIPYTKYNKTILTIQPADDHSNGHIHGNVTPMTNELIKGFALSVPDQIVRRKRKRKNTSNRKDPPKKRRSVSKQRKPNKSSKPRKVKRTGIRKNIF